MWYWEMQIHSSFCCIGKPQVDKKSSLHQLLLLIYKASYLICDPPIFFSWSVICATPLAVVVNFKYPYVIVFVCLIWSLTRQLFITLLFPCGNMHHMLYFCEISEVITCAEFHPTHCNTLAYSSSKGAIRLIDLRQSALCDNHSKLLVITPCTSWCNSYPCSEGNTQ